MKIKQISEIELVITKNAWRKRLVGLILAGVLPLLPLIYKITKDYLPEGSEGYSVSTAALIGLIGVGLVIFSHNVKIRMQKGLSVEISRRSLFGKAKKEIVQVDSIQALQVVAGRSTDLAFIMKDGSTAVHFYSHQNQMILGLGKGNDLAVESQQIATFLGVPLHSKGSVMAAELTTQVFGVATEILRPDTVKMAAANEDHWDQQRLGQNSAHQQLANREVRNEILSTVLPKTVNPADPQGQKPLIKDGTIDLVNRVIERPNIHNK